jgi:hypothetical protein
VARRRRRTHQVLAADLASQHHIRDLVDAAKLRWRIERDIRNSSRRSGSAITKGADGQCSIIMALCASRPTDS